MLGLKSPDSLIEHSILIGGIQSNLASIIENGILSYMTGYITTSILICLDSSSRRIHLEDTLEWLHSYWVLCSTNWSSLRQLGSSTLYSFWSSQVQVDIWIFRDDLNREQKENENGDNQLVLLDWNVHGNFNHIYALSHWIPGQREIQRCFCTREMGGLALLNSKNYLHDLNSLNIMSNIILPISSK